MQITLGPQYNVGEKPTVILYIYINRHAGTVHDDSVIILLTQCYYLILCSTTALLAYVNPA